MVLGCGGVGLNLIQAAKLASAYPIIGVDIYDDKNKQNILSRVLSVSEINDIIKKSYGK